MGHEPHTEDLSRPPRPKVAKSLHVAALGYPETREDHPWGERAYKVAGKVFLFMHALEREGRGSGFGATMKLPFRAADALAEPWAEPAGYGMGKHGWVSMRFPSDVEPPLETLLDWLDESYRAVAPKRIVKSLAAGDAKPESPKKKARRGRRAPSLKSDPARA